ncbi:alpha/beta-hydrolase [Punctularia strigosozonata HHB-11173 SS5]|uniref:alpha/beta-hydrolase n=1 Tax=Punctularia strigosozonata (strain HHB-11173) TaxID=741275 RepID=UPI0004417103|nr:alpha/beta-hydrolase [Punctularia strigosozonata HHB-11173 SS5]EIN11020.1 alpha/beta-hydrolase [Punctularia strigosozonata HHB-11173 SS5]
MHPNFPTALLFSVLAIPALFALSHISFPHPPTQSGLRIYPGIDALPAGPVRDRALQIYGEDYWTGGGWFNGPFGRVRYWLLGPEKGKKIVLIHGLSVPAIIWKDVAPYLVKKGFRVLVYDLLGRGYSSAPDATETSYTAALYATQLALLMQHIGWQKANIAGVSMGGGIAAAFAAYFPALIDEKVALVCPAGLLEASEIPRTMRFMSAPLLQTVTNSPPIRYYLHRLASSRADVAAKEQKADIAESSAQLVRIQSALLPGYNAAIASSLREGPVRGQRASYEALGKSGKDVLLVWGTADTVVPFHHAVDVQGMVPQAKLVTIEGGPHDITLTHPDQVGTALVDFFVR